MSATIAEVLHGRIKLDEPTDLPDGTRVRIYIVDDGDEFDEEDRRALDDALEAAAQSLERGETIAADEVLRLLDADG